MGYSAEQFPRKRTVVSARQGCLPALKATSVILPAAKNYFAAGIEPDAFRPLHMEVTKKRLSPPREWEQGHWRWHTNIHAHHAAVDVTGQLPSLTVHAGRQFDQAGLRHFSRLAACCS